MKRLHPVQLDDVLNSFEETAQCRAQNLENMDRIVGRLIKKGRRDQEVQTEGWESPVCDDVSEPV
jgi:hypothetical protein